MIKYNIPYIYAFIVPEIKECVKIGFTYQGVDKRIEQWKKEYPNLILVGYWPAYEFTNGEHKFFKDHIVHKEVIKAGYSNITHNEFIKRITNDTLTNVYYSSEFFDENNIDSTKEKLSKYVIDNIINYIKYGIKENFIYNGVYSLEDNSKSSREFDEPMIYNNTQEQDKCKNNAIKSINEALSNNQKLDMLMCAVMRFGKTHCTYDIIKEANLKYVIVVSAKADTREAWREDINHIDFYKDFVFIEFKGSNKYLITEFGENSLKTYEVVKEPNDNLIETKRKSGKYIIVYATLQDLTGTGKRKEKHNYIFDNECDLLVMDESHVGTRSKTFGKATGYSLDEISDEEISDNKIHDELDKKLKEIPHKKSLQCSGTPYYILASGEFGNGYENKKIICEYSYSDIIESYHNWITNNPDKHISQCPYFGVPYLHKIGLKLSESCYKKLKFNNWTEQLNILFSIKKNKFVYEDIIIEIFKDLFDGNFGALNSNDIIEGRIFRHIIGILPSINACHLLKKLFIENNLNFNRDIIVCVSKNDLKADICAKDVESLNNHLNELEKKNTRSLILTVNRFLTGVTLPKVDSILFMKDTKSPQEYDQAIFRCCSRNISTIVDEYGNKEKINLKENVYVIDFNIHRMYQMTVNSAQYKAAAAGYKDPEEVKQFIKSEINIIPIWEGYVNELISDKLHIIKSEDLMKVYLKYSPERNIDNEVNNHTFNFNINCKQLLSIKLTNSIGKNKIKNTLGSDELETEYAKIQETTNNSDKTKKVISKDDKNKILEHLKVLMNKIILLNLVNDTQYSTIDKVILNSSNEYCDYLGIDKLTVLNIYAGFNNADKLFLNDKLGYANVTLKEKGFSKAIKYVSRIDKNEVVTPTLLVEKMINKVDIKSTDKILLVNEKQCEFVIKLINKFGKDFVKNIYIVPSSCIGKKMIIKILKEYEVYDYIKNNIYNAYCLTGDFLNMKNEDILKKNGRKKFDVVLMNPPYDKNIHLKFLEKVTKLGNIVLSIQPIEWLEDVFAEEKRSAYKKYENSISKYIKNIERLNVHDVSDIFGIESHGNLGIYFVNSNNTYDFYKKFRYDTKSKNISDIIKNFKYNLTNVIENNKINGIRVKLSPIKNAPKGRYKDDPAMRYGLMYRSYSSVFNNGYGLDQQHKWWSLYGSKNKYTKDEGEPMPCSIKFNTIKEAKNFEKYCWTKFIVYCNYISKVGVNTNFRYIPWMGDIKWTGKSGEIDGYKNEITDNMLIEFFNLSNEDLKFINSIYDEQFK